MGSLLQTNAELSFKQEIKHEYKDLLSQEAINFLKKLHHNFSDKRLELLKNRELRQKKINNGVNPTFLTETKSIRESNWQVGNTPTDLQDRRVEITGPVDRKMVINALNSEANVFMADFEDSTSPTWDNVMSGQINLQDAINKTISFTNPDGKTYKLNEKTATLIVRPRGWHLIEKNVLVDGTPISGSLFDFGLYFFHNAKNLTSKETGPYFYLPKLENHLEARLWNDIFVFAQNELNIPIGTIKVTVLIETILAAFETEEILYELREHIVGLNAGRWDYIFSAIKKFRNTSGLLFPDRSQITMTVPFMKAYSQLLVKNCHKRGAHAMGGMSAFIPSRKDKEVNDNALLKVREDKLRETNDGFDGTWVDHPDLVSVAKEIFDQKLGLSLNQKHILNENIEIKAEQLIDFNIPEGKITEAGIRNNISVAIQYIGAWLNGLGAVAIHNLMEDAATAEISRSQLWQWLHNGNVVLDNGKTFTQQLFKQYLKEETQKIKESLNVSDFSKYQQAADILDKIVSQEEFIEFLTLETYKYI